VNKFSKVSDAIEAGIPLCEQCFGFTSDVDKNQACALGTAAVAVLGELKGPNIYMGKALDICQEAVVPLLDAVPPTAQHYEEATEGGGDGLRVYSYVLYLNDELHLSRENIIQLLREQGL